MRISQPASHSGAGWKHINLLLLVVLLTGSFVLAAATNARAAGEAREGYVRVSAVLSTEKVYGVHGGGCAVLRFLIWEKVANEDLEEPFFGHYLKRGQEVTRAMVSPFHDEGTGSVHKFSGAPAGHHKQALGAPSTAPHPDPGTTRDEDCDEIIERSNPDYEADPSQIWVEVPVAVKVDSTECADARSKAKRLKRKATRLSDRSGEKAKRKLRKTRRQLKAARRQVRNRC